MKLGRIARNVKMVNNKILEAEEPTKEEIEKLMVVSGLDYYNARERLRNDSYGKLPHGYNSWGDYWKSF